MPFRRGLHLRYNETKAAQLAARLLLLSGGRMNYMKLIKLMYLADRTALKEWGRPISTDRYVSMKHGPVLSLTLDRISHGPEPGLEAAWDELISEPEHYEVSLRTSSVPNGELSPAEERVIDQVVQDFGGLDQWKLVDYLHTLEEWEDPGESSFPISYRDILLACGKSSGEIDAMEEELRNVAAMERFSVST